MKIYITSYASYNAGTHAGRWFRIDNFNDRHELLTAAVEYLNAADPDNDHEELFFTDWENIPDGMIAESGAEWDVLFQLAQMDDTEQRITAGYYAWTGDFDPDAAQDAFYGFATSTDDYHALLVDMWYECNEVPDHCSPYIDEDAIVRDMDYDFYHDEDNDLVFRNC